MGRLWNNSKGSVSDQKSNDSNKIHVLSMNQIQELQKILLMMMKDIDKLCRSHDLHYVLIGGTAIGSLRHNGFIPWDDDVDIAMSRADYEKFLQLVNKEYKDKYTLSDAIRKNNYGKLIPKFRLNGTVYKTLLDLDPNDVQMKVDIFIIENVFDNQLIYCLHGLICTFMGFCLSCRRLQEGKSVFSSYYSGRDYRIKLIIGRILNFASLEQWAYWTERWYSRCHKDHSKRVTIPADGLHYFKGTISREAICEVKEGDFAENKFYLPKKYDFYLKRIYGDYMQIPPEEKRMLSNYSDIDFGKYREYINLDSLN